jgi:hypothetical protein
MSLFSGSNSTGTCLKHRGSATMPTATGRPSFIYRGAERK